jgi:hypothetical protein
MIFEDGSNMCEQYNGLHLLSFGHLPCKVDAFVLEQLLR